MKVILPLFLASAVTAKWKRPKWRPWGQWGSCSATCGKATKTRSRKCPVPGRCKGKPTQTKKCKGLPSTCGEAGEWGAWSEWQNCWGQCGKAREKRKRTCKGPGKCEGKKLVKRPCTPARCQTTKENPFTRPVSTPTQIPSKNQGENLIYNGGAELWPKWNNGKWKCNNCEVERSPKPRSGKGAFRVKKRMHNWAGLEYDLGDVGQEQLEYDMWVKPVHSRPVNITVTTKFIAPDGNWTYENQETQKVRPWQWAQLRGPIETKADSNILKIKIYVEGDGLFTYDLDDVVVKELGSKPTVRPITTSPSGWGEWTEWSKCSAKCGPGEKKRLRKWMVDGLDEALKTHGFGITLDSETDTANCNDGPCVKPPTPVKGNIIRNGDAEDAISSPWFCNNCALSHSSDSANGHKSFSVTNRKGSWAGLSYELPSTVQPKQEYLFVAWVKTKEDSTVIVTVKLDVGAEEPLYEQQIKEEIHGGEWVKISGSVKISKSGQYVIYIEGMNGADFLADGISLVPVDSKPVVESKPVDEDQKFSDPDFEISPNWGIGWGCKGCNGVRQSEDVKSGKFAMKITNREESWSGPTQKLKYGSHIRKNVVYSMSMWVKSLGNDKELETFYLTVKTDFRNKQDTWHHFAKVCTYPGEWALLNGLVQITPDPAEIIDLEFYVQGPEPGREFIVDNSSLKLAKVPQSFHDQAESEIDRIRKVNLEVTANYENFGSIVVEQQKHDFPIGTAIDAKIFIANEKYRDFFYKHFNHAVFENRMKYRQIEWTSGKRKFEDVDKVMDMLEAKDIAVRGHAVFWAVDKNVPEWLPKLPVDKQMERCRAHAAEVVGRYKGRLIHWDVNNEMLHGNYFERTFGGDIRKQMFQWTKDADPSVQTFVNDYDILSGGLTNCYKAQVEDLLEQGAPLDGIGLQSHFKGIQSNIDPVAMQSKLDTLAETGLPLWITEFDVSKKDPVERARYLSYFMKAAFSHEAVKGIMLWGFWDDRHWRGVEASLVEGPDFVPNAAGKKFYELFYKQWWTNLKHTEKNLNTRVFKGDYVVTVYDKSGTILSKENVNITKDAKLCFGKC